jgi:hypothetical protein
LKEKKTILITVETSETFVYRPAARRRRAWCDACATWVEMVSPEQAALIAGTSARAVFRLIASGQLHFTEEPEGTSWVCLDALNRIEEWENSENV